MAHKFFLSWQVDTPTSEGRNFIENCLSKALLQVARDAEIEEAVRDEGLAVDSDTKDVSGMPPIMDIIFGKIDVAAAFVADLTFVGRRLDGKRLMPNPNVIIEYGWAMKSLTYNRVIGVMNTAYGDPATEPLPFDLGHLRRPICYNLAANADEATRKIEREKLVSQFKKAAQAVLKSKEFLKTLPLPPQPAVFVSKAPQDGLARFRLKDSPLGLSEGGGIFGGKINEKIFLESGPATWLHIFPSNALNKEFSSEEIKVAMNNDLLMPMGRMSPLDTIRLRAIDGYGRFIAPKSETGETLNAGMVAFTFKSGEVWTVNSSCLGGDINHYAENGRFGIPVGLEQHFRRAFFDYTTVLSRLGVSPPYSWIAGLEGIEGQRLCVPMSINNFAGFTTDGHCATDTVKDQGTYNLGDSITTILSPLFRKLYEACNVSRPDWLDIES